MPVDRQRGVGFVAFQHEVHRRTCRLQGWIIEGPFGKHRRVSSREKQDISFPQGHLKMLRQRQDHLAARTRTAALHEAEMLLGDFGIEREVELAQAAALPPGTQVVA